MENRTTVLERRTLCFSSCKHLKLNVKLWWVGARKGKKRAFFVPFLLSEENVFDICVLSQCVVYWIHYWIRYWIHYYISKNITLCTFCLFLESIKSCQCILNFILTVTWSTSLYASLFLQISKSMNIVFILCGIFILNQLYCYMLFSYFFAWGKE